jgi:hypothetical protein
MRFLTEVDLKLAPSPPLSLRLVARLRSSGERRSRVKRKHIGKGGGGTLWFSVVKDKRGGSPEIGDPATIFRGSRGLVSSLSHCQAINSHQSFKLLLRGKR